MEKSKAANIFYHVFVIIFGIFMIYPIVWMIASSLKSNADIFVNASSLIPSPIKWENYVIGWEGFGNVGFGTFFKNSAIITSFVIVGTLLSSSIVAFGFARLDFKFKTFFFVCLMTTMMIPMQVTMIPQYILFDKLNWINTFLPLIVPAFFGGGPFFTFLLMQFIRGIPRELDEAAIIDGCSTYGVFWRIILPLCKPALVTAGLFAFMWTWDDFLGPLIYLNDTSLYTVSLGLRMFADPASVTDWGAMFGMATLSLIPQFIIFLFFQRYIVEGIATTGVKG